MKTKKSVKETRAGIIPQSDWDKKEAQAVKDDKTKVVTVQLDTSQLATVLAALRSFQERYQNCDAGTIVDDWQDHFEGVMPLGSEDISNLCEEINCSPKPEPPVIVVKGGCVQDVVLPIPDGKSPTTSIAYSLIDYDDMDGLGDDGLRQLWDSFSPALRLYYAAHCRDEFNKYFKAALDSQPRIIPTKFGNQKKRPKCYRCGWVIRDAEYMREGPIGEGKARHINACPPPKR